MNRSLAIAFILAAALHPALPQEAKWEDQIREMQYLIMQISAINAVNAMNLTAKQATKLATMVRRVEAAGAWKPANLGPFEPRLETVRQTYYDLRKVLMKGQTVPKSLEMCVGKARILEAAVVRESMATAPRGVERTGQCTRCHVRPPAAAKGSSAQEAAADRRLHRLRNTDQKGTFMAHLNGLYGVGGTVALTRCAPQIDAMLTGPQKDIIQKFSCCLIPPDDLSDPVRAGQAEVSERAMRLMRLVRSTKDAAWPRVKSSLLSRMIEGQKAKKPALSQQDQKEIRSHFGEVFEKARSLSDVDFEMEKEDLCRELDLRQPADARPANTRRFMAAMFLLVPGMDTLYTHIAQRQRGD